MKSLFQLFILTLLFITISCEEKKSLKSEDVLTSMRSSTAKSMDEALVDPAAISSLNLNEQELESFPKELDERFVNLRQLSLQKNKIKEVPVSIGKLTNLQSL